MNCFLTSSGKGAAGSHPDPGIYDNRQLKNTPSTKDPFDMGKVS